MVTRARYGPGWMFGAFFAMAVAVIVVALWFGPIIGRVLVGG